MFDCADFGCSTGKEDGGCRIVKIFIRETQQSGFICHVCDLNWWTDDAKNIPEITNDYFSRTPTEFHLFSAIYSSNPSKLYLEKYRPIIIDDEFIAYKNDLDIEMFLDDIRRGQTRGFSRETGIFKVNRIQVTDMGQAKRLAALLNSWISSPQSIPKRVSQLIFPTHYPNAISPEVWDYIKSVNPDIQILNQENEPISRPEE